MDRLQNTIHVLDGMAPFVSRMDTYDDYGRLKSRSFHNRTYTAAYTHDLRDRLTSIDGSGFSQTLHYTDGPGTPRYDGNISSMTWKSGNEGTLRGYKFSYDHLDRLTSAVYGEGADISSNPDRFTERVTAYDRNGNILALQRYGQTGADSYGLVDDLTLTLDGNLLSRVDDAAGTNAYGGGFEFRDNVKQTEEYAYDANGNLVKDLNRNILSVSYNPLNLPDTVRFVDGSTISYVYAYDGTKVRAVHSIKGVTTVTDYRGHTVYENGVAGRILTDDGYLSLPDKKFRYYLKDHQGNNRLVIGEDGTVEEVNHYYPFGGMFAGTDSVQPYKYNGKEFDGSCGLDWYDYGARRYDAALGRFTTQDAFAEKYPALSPYQYGANNPIANIDVNGDSIVTTLTTQRDGKTVNIDYTYRADENGIYGFFDSEGNQYTGDGYISELSDALSTLREGKTGKSLVDYLATSSKTVRIRDLRSSETGNAADGKGEYVKWSPSKTEGGLDEKGNTGRPPFVGLGHELAHIQDVWKGTVDNGVWLDSEKYNLGRDVRNAEKYATYMENKIRAEHNLPLRIYYTQRPLRKALLINLRTRENLFFK